MSKSLSELVIRHTVEEDWEILKTVCLEAL